jgi:hypothetical protein
MFFMVNLTAGDDMEIETTVKDFSRKIRMLKIDPETTIRVIVDNIQDDKKNGPDGSKLAFLHSGFWDDEGGLTDIAENHDRYIYDSEDPHGSR